MNALGVLPEVAERCLNHMEENKIKRIYQRYGYEAEMRQAWEKLGERLELLTKVAYEQHLQSDHHSSTSSIRAKTSNWKRH